MSDKSGGTGILSVRDTLTAIRYLSVAVRWRTGRFAGGLLQTQGEESRQAELLQHRSIRRVLLPATPLHEACQGWEEAVGRREQQEPPVQLTRGCWYQWL